MQIVRVAIRLAVLQAYGLRVEAVKKPFGPGLGTLVPLAVRLGWLESMTIFRAFF